MEYRLAELAEKVGGDVHGDGDLTIRGVAGIKEATAGQITFLDNPRYEEWLAQTSASAVILYRDHPFNGRTGIGVDRPREAFRMVMNLFHPQRSPVPVGVHPSALVAPDVRLGEGVAVGPFVVIGEKAVVGDRTVLMPGVVVGPDVSIGSDCLIYPNVVIREESRLGDEVIVHAGAVLGADGFGFVSGANGHAKVPQLGRVVIEDNVEIGANTCIDRATTGITLIRAGSRLDNLVQVAHNVTIGRDSILCAQVGIAGSTNVGDQVTLAGQVGIVGHIQIGDRAMVGAQGGVTKSVPADTQVSGYPATPHHLAKRMYAALRRLPDLIREVKRLSRRVEDLEEKS